MNALDPALIRPLIRAALTEDASHGDITSEACLPRDARSRAKVITREACRVAGLDLSRMIFEELDPACRFHTTLSEGQEVAANTTLFTLEGPSRALLQGERTALNFLSRLCGVATMTARYVECLQGTRARLLDTRKTTPGLRLLEKYAVRVGGGLNHRFSLSDGVLLKENHLRASGGITAAVKRAREHVPPSLALEVEVTNLQELREALSAGVDMIMLDNMSLSEMSEAVAITQGRARLEASGNVTLDRLAEIAATGVDFISTSATIRKAPWIDLSMLFDTP
jgi:nicotinate-nucleotide pyrophosphorylase (carboxylating)